MKSFKTLHLLFISFLLSGSAVFGELLSNSGFESGTADWEARNCTIAAESGHVHAGGGSVYVYNRNATWKSVRQNILPTILAYGSGTEYNYSAWVKMATPGTHEVKLRLRLVFDDGTPVANNEFKANANDSGWTQVSNTKTITWSGNLSEAWLEIANSTTTAEYYVDDCTLTTTGASIPPTFNADPIIESPASIGVPYAATLADNASDAEGDALTFFLLDTPTWLSVASDGSLTGTPSLSDLGLNRFNVMVQDASGSNDTAVLEITVIEPRPAGRPHYAEPFETNQLWTTTFGKPGWSADEWNAPQIRAAAVSYTGTFPIQGVRHEQVLDVNGPVTNTFGGTLVHSNLLFDAMIQPALRTDPGHPPAGAASQAAFYFNTNGKLVVNHAVYTGNFTAVNRQWTELNHATVANGQWVRLTISCDYLSDELRNDNFFSVELDGVTLTSDSAYNTNSPTDEIAHMGGSLFLCADSGFGGGSATMSGLALDGLARVDELMLSAPFSVTAQGTPFEWIEAFYPGSDHAAYDLLDTDGDGLATWQEYNAGTDPTDPNSTFIGSIMQHPSGDMVVFWRSAFDGLLAPYAMYCSTNLMAPDGGWELVEGSILRDVSGTNTWINPAPPDAPAVFYRPAIQTP